MKSVVTERRRSKIKMQDAINFRELRRQERQRVRASRHQSSDVNVDASGTVAARQGPVSTSLPSCSNASAPIEHPLSPFRTLLPHNELSDDARVGQIDVVHYARRFLAPEHGEEILSWLHSVPDYAPRGPRRVRAAGRTEEEDLLAHDGTWPRLTHARRRVAVFDGTLRPLPPLLRRLARTLVAAGAFPPASPPNHVLVNEYRPGEGILPHTDGPAYESRTATISLGGSDVVFALRPRRRHDGAGGAPAPAAALEVPATHRPAVLEVILHGDGSLVVFADDAYLGHEHEIREGVLEEVTSPDGVCGNDVRGGTVVKRGWRVSLTLRRKKSAGEDVASLVQREG